MRIDNKIIEEIKRFNTINKYISEQEVPPPPPAGEVPPPPAGEVPPPPAGEVPPPGGALPPAPEGAAPPTPPVTGGTPVDLATDTEVEKIGDEKDKDVKELDITDLVKSQKSVEKKQEDYFDSLFKHLQDLEQKLNSMDSLVQKLNDLETKIEKIRPKSPEEKLELRTLDSGPFNQKLSDFFEDKQEDYEKLGRNEYIMTQDDVENYNPNEVRKSFRSFEDEDQQFTQIK